MALVYLIEASPENASGVVVPIRMAGGGSRGYDHKGYTDWLAGVASRPLRQAAIGYDQDGWTGGSRPSTLTMTYSAASRVRMAAIGRLLWREARVIVSVGDDSDASPVFTVLAIGVVTSFSVQDNTASLTITDVSADLDKPVCPNDFDGTGGVEGDDAARGREKRRTFGRVFNVEGRVLNAANNIYEFGDPAYGFSSFAEVRDIGRAASSSTIVTWKGSVSATLDALKAAAAPSGGGAYAPSISCVKWWTQPNGPLTADIVASTETALGKVALQVATSIASNVAMSIAEADALTAARPGQCGLHVEAGETVANALDRLLLGASSIWAVDGGGVLRFRTWSFTSPVASLSVDRIARSAQLLPLLRRRVGFQKNYRVQSASEISAAVASTDVYYVDGTPIEVLKPQEGGANRTETRQAAAIAGQGSLATKSAVDLSTGDVANRYADYLNYRDGSTVENKRPQEAGANVTENRSANAIAGQGALATQSQATGFVCYSDTNIYSGSGGPDSGSASGGSGGSIRPGQSRL